MRVYRGTDKRSEPAYPSEPLSIDSLSLGILHLGKKTLWFEEAGYRSIGDIRDLDPDIMVRIPLIGRSTADELVRKRSALIAASRNDFGTDWSAYCETIDIPLLPTECRPASGEAFLTALSVFFNEVADRLPDAIFAAILRDRIFQPPGEQKTLEDIAQLNAPPLSRERVRQKEEKLLRQLTGGLLNDDYDTLAIHFHPDFCRWWRKAADALADLDEIEVTTFIDILCDVWNVPPRAVMEQLPVIVAIVTGEPQMSGEFRAATKINPKLFSKLADEVKTLPVNRLRLGKYAAMLAEAGFSCLGDLIGGLQSGAIDRVGPTATKRAAAQLEILGTCITPDGNADWSAYRQATSLASIPPASPVSPSDFVSSLRDEVERMLRVHLVTKRSADIFRLRTGRDAAQRMTLQRVADELNTHLPTIKREETVLLQWLNDAVVAHDFSMLKVWLDDKWLRYWGEALEVHEATNDDYERFAENLAWRWRLTDRDIRAAAPAVWAVLTGYPGRRRSSWTPSCPAPTAGVLTGRIRLKGFRRLH